MRNSCAKFVDLVGVIGGEVRYFYTTLATGSGGVEKQPDFTTLFTRLFPSFFHYNLLVFQSINYRVLPITHNTNKYNNEYKLTINNYWRMSV
jgi:hypothetical protein